MFNIFSVVQLSPHEAYPPAAQQTDDGESYTSFIVNQKTIATTVADINAGNKSLTAEDDMFFDARSKLTEDTASLAARQPPKEAHIDHRPADDDGNDCDF